MTATLPTLSALPLSAPTAFPALPLSVEDAQRINSMIEDEIKRESIKRREARKNEVKVMLLGQAESGKSTLQKQFQIHYASRTLERERPTWRPVVYFNVVKAVRMIIDELDHEFSNSAPSDDSEIEEMPRTPVVNGFSLEEMKSQISELRSALLPLIAIENSLASELSGGVSISGGRTGAFVRSGWQSLIMPGHDWSSSDVKEQNSSKVVTLAAKTLQEKVNDVVALWKHVSVRNALQLRKLRLDDSAAFFLTEIRRISKPDYIPTTNDILHVRLQTLGVMEHSFPVHIGGSTYNWKLYDVGGARGQRHAWIPYFDDATAIIFLAPMSAFDQYLEEDPKTNRMEDSLQLFTAICSNKLLKDAHLVLLLNKVDLLRKKLDAGISVRKYITSYGDRPNEYERVADYFRSHFLQVHRRKDPYHRVLYIHFTSMLDISATQGIISNVGEAIIRKHITEIGLV